MNTNSSSPSTILSGRNAFSLIEVILALGVFSIAMAANMALIGTIFNGVRSVNDRDQAVGLTSTLEDTLTNATLDNVYTWVKGGSSAPKLYAYHYRGEISADSSQEPTPVPNASTTSYTLVPALRPANSTRINTELQAREGPLYQVVLKVSNANPITSANLPANAAAYTESVLAVNASFYPVGSTTATLRTNLAPAHTITVTYRR